MIRTVRSALEPLIMSSGDQLDDEAFRTFMTEAECIVNSRPLAVNELSDPEILEPLTPNHLLTLKPKILLPPPGKFQRTDLYSRKWWRRVQYLTNEFWLRWRREFLNNLQSRQKWILPIRQRCSLIIQMQLIIIYIGAINGRIINKQKITVSS